MIFISAVPAEKVGALAVLHFLPDSDRPAQILGPLGIPCHPLTAPRWFGLLESWQGSVTRAEHGPATVRPRLQAPRRPTRTVVPWLQVRVRIWMQLAIGCYR
jgi:hypothetical protein